MKTKDRATLASATTSVSPSPWRRLVKFWAMIVVKLSD